MKRGVDHPGVCVVFHCHDGQGNFVMGKRSKSTRDEQGKWDQGGGAVEFGEKAEDALRREIKEEYGAEVKNASFLGFMDVHRIDSQKNKTHWIALCYKVLVDKGQIKNAAPKDHDEIGWFTLSNLPEPLHSQMPEFIKMFRKYL